MVIKMMRSNGEVMYSGEVRNFIVRPITPDVYAKEYDTTRYDSTALLHHEMSDKQLKPIVKGTKYGIIELVVFFTDGKSEKYMTDSEVYLVSSNGKTIERIG